ncbi:MAG: DUF1595 domain-containing protein, partial [Myxococcota bacterium]
MVDTAHMRLHDHRPARARRFNGTKPWIFAALASMATVGCYRGLDGTDGVGGGANEGDGGDDAGGPGPDMLCEEGPKPGVLPRMVRLTHAQYDATIADLFGVQTAVSEDFLDDAAVGGFRNNAQALTVTDRLARDYRRAAEQVAGEFATDPALLAAALPCAADADAACAETFIRTFGRRAYRRPLTDEELDKYGQIYFLGGDLYPTGSSFEQGIRLVVEALLQSPNVLYRVELSSDVSESNEDLVPLSGYEVATRLSFLLWNSTPNDTLLDAAEAG